MKRAIFLVGLSSLLLAPACKKADEGDKTGESAAVVQDPGAARPANNMQAPSNGAPTSGMSGAGTVSETMNAGGYTYVKLDGSQGQVWAAAPETTVKVGDQVSFASGMPMEGFRSNTLNRTFDLVYFVPGLTINGASPAPAAGHAAPLTAQDAGAVDLGGITKPKGGQTVAEVFANKAALGGKEVILRGKVVKYNSGIMGRNWLHIQDGSGAEGSNDLTITTSNESAVGATVLVKGTVGLDKDFGAGYQYAVIVEDATVSAE